MKLLVTLVHLWLTVSFFLKSMDDKLKRHKTHMQYPSTLRRYPFRGTKDRQGAHLVGNHSFVECGCVGGNQLDRQAINRGGRLGAFQCHEDKHGR